MTVLLINKKYFIMFLYLSTSVQMLFDQNNIFFNAKI